MVPGEHAPFQVPSFLQGDFTAVERQARAEGQRCATQYRKDGSFPLPREWVTAPPGEAVLMHEVTDFVPERPAIRLYMVSNLMGALTEALNWQDTFQVRDRYEAWCLDMPWGALYFAVAQPGAMRAERVARRLQAVLHFWEPLQAAHYRFKILQKMLSLEDLLLASCDWAMEAWCPEGAASVRARLKVAAERMARATREDSIEAILRQMPKALAHAQKLKHRDVLANPASMRQHLTTLDSAAFERMSAACTPDLLEHLYDWDHQLGMH